MLISAGSAVSVGAIYMAVWKAMFGRRTFQQSLGIAQDEVFDRAIHAPSRKVSDPDRKQYEARNCYVPLCNQVSSHTIRSGSLQNPKIC